MRVKREASNIVVTGTVAGSVFPSSEVDIAYPILVDGSAKPTHVGGAVYGRSVDLRGDVRIDGPVLVRGDVRVAPGNKTVRLGSGITINGSLNAVVDAPDPGRTLIEAIENARIIIKGDIAVNQNAALRNAIIFGSIRAVNCTLERCLVLGTCIVDEQLKVSMSTIGGYACGGVVFEGRCAMLHTIGESRSPPLFTPFEEGDGTLIENDIRFYPAVRGGHPLLNRPLLKGESFPEYSSLDPDADWVEAIASPNPALGEEASEAVSKWVLSIGGRIGDFTKVARGVDAMAGMLKCGFEFEHYAPARRPHLLQKALEGLTDEEAWILRSVCGDIG